MFVVEHLKDLNSPGKLEGVRLLSLYFYTHLKTLRRQGLEDEVTDKFTIHLAPNHLREYGLRRR
jgi:hypothetical protein